MFLRVLTLRYSDGTQGFPEDAVREACADRNVRTTLESSRRADGRRNHLPPGPSPSRHRTCRKVLSARKHPQPAPTAPPPQKKKKKKKKDAISHDNRQVLCGNCTRVQ